MGGLLHLVQRGGDWAQPAQAAPRSTNCNSPPINAKVPITVFVYNGPLLCGFNVPNKGLTIGKLVTIQSSVFLSSDCFATF